MVIRGNLKFSKSQKTLSLLLIVSRKNKVDSSVSVSNSFMLFPGTRDK